MYNRRTHIKNQMHEILLEVAFIILLWWSSRWVSLHNKGLMGDQKIPILALVWTYQFRLRHHGGGEGWEGPG